MKKTIILTNKNVLMRDIENGMITHLTQTWNGKLITGKQQLLEYIIFESEARAKEKYAPAIASEILNSFHLMKPNKKECNKIFKFVRFEDDCGHKD
jgi:hypothetical protein